MNAAPLVLRKAGTFWGAISYNDLTGKPVPGGFWISRFPKGGFHNGADRWL